MSRKYYIFVLFVMAFLIMPAAIVISTYAQDEDDSDIMIDSDLFLGDGTTFMELHLSPDGIYGVDSSGTEWEYDFSRDKFVDEELDSHRKSTITVFGRDNVRISSDELDELDELADLKDMEMLDKEQLAQLAEHAAQLAEMAMIKKYKGLQLRSVTVEIDEVVTGSIFAIGEITVKGTVTGDVVSYDRVTITSTGVIDGDVRAPEIVKMRGGTILGERHETDLPDVTNFPDFVDMTIFEKTSYTPLIVILIIFFSLMFFGLVGIGVSPKPIIRVKNCLEQQLLKSFLIGFAGWFALGPLMAILVLTIIGIPVAVLVLPLSLVLGVVLGILGAGQLAGQISGKYLGMEKGTLVKQMIPGLTILFTPWIFMSLFMISSSGVAVGFAILFRIIAIIIWSVVVSAGIGAVVLTRFGTREYVKSGKDGVKVSVNIRPSPKPPTPPPTPPPLNPKDEE